MENLDRQVTSNKIESVIAKLTTKVQYHGDSLVNSIKHLNKFNSYTLGSMNILTILSLLTNEHNVIFHFCFVLLNLFHQCLMVFKI